MAICAFEMVFWKIRLAEKILSNVTYFQNKYSSWTVGETKMKNTQMIDHLILIRMMYDFTTNQAIEMVQMVWPQKSGLMHATLHNNED